MNIGRLSTGSWLLLTMWTIPVALAVAYVLADCAAPAADASTSDLREAPVTLDDGREITCVIYGWGYRGGLSCDWATPGGRP